MEVSFKLVWTFVCSLWWLGGSSSLIWQCNPTLHADHQLSENYDVYDTKCLQLNVEI